ncbi:MAG: tail fiber assembly protein [Plesiomonas sp.]
MPLWVDIPPLHHDDIVTNAENFKQMLINSALQSINIIQLKLQSDRSLTIMEKTKLDNVLDYIDAVNEIDTSTAPNIKWPTLPAELAK